MGDKMKDYMHNTKILLSVIVLAISATAYAFTTFAQKSDVDRMDKKLDRIENCLFLGECTKQK